MGVVGIIRDQFGIGLARLVGVARLFKALPRAPQGIRRQFRMKKKNGHAHVTAGRLVKIARFLKQFAQAKARPRGHVAGVGVGRLFVERQRLVWFLQRFVDARHPVFRLDGPRRGRGRFHHRRIALESVLGIAGLLGAFGNHEAHLFRIGIGGCPLQK